MNVVRVGLLGLGTVGSGVVKTIRSQEKKLTERLGKKVEIVKALVRDLAKERLVEVDSCLLTTRYEDVLDNNVDIIVEVMGVWSPLSIICGGQLKKAVMWLPPTKNCWPSAAGN
jgi:homoserine dehydrogenase